MELWRERPVKLEMEEGGSKAARNDERKVVRGRQSSFWCSRNGGKRRSDTLCSAADRERDCTGRQVKPSGVMALPLKRGEVQALHEKAERRMVHK